MIKDKKKTPREKCQQNRRMIQDILWDIIRDNECSLSHEKKQLYFLKKKESRIF